MASVPFLQIIYASTSGHTEYVIQVLTRHLGSPKLVVQCVRAEAARPEDFLKGDLLVLASGTWNTGGVEGQMNPYMDELLKGRAKDVDLKGKPTAIVTLGDKRYFYTARAGEHMRSFVVKHGGKVMGQPLTIINEPYGQEGKIVKWGEKLLALIASAKQVPSSKK